MVAKFIFAICALCSVVSSEIVSPIDVRNDKSGEIFKDVLVQPIIQTFRDFVNKKRNRNYWYLPTDVFLIQTITSMQHAMFQIGAYYAIHKNHEGLPITLFEKGFAIQFESILCDRVYSSKFPRSQPPVSPWYDYTDSSYFRLNCKMKQKVKPRINSRTKRALVNVNKNPLCGPVSTFSENQGTISFPFNSTGLYYNSMRCEWTIEVAPSFGIEVYSNYIHLEYDPRCYYDSITFHEGEDASGDVIERTCGHVTDYRVKSRKNVMTIVFKADETITKNGFVLHWKLTDQVTDHPGYIMTSTIVLDQVGDVHIDPARVAKGLTGSGRVQQYSINPDFKLFITDPQTCDPLESNVDPQCVFQTKPYIVSKLIATGVSPDFQLEEDSILVVFEHAIQENLYPDLYNSPKYCVTWDASIKKTKFGSWSRRYGKSIQSSAARTTCLFSRTGVHAVIAMEPPPMEPESFRFTRSWYCGHFFAVFWITVTFIKLSSGLMNIPIWLNFNQLLSVMLFCGICLSGVHMEQHDNMCTFLTFALYYFGLATFVWHLLKAAQYTGLIDKFFQEGRNLYAFYFLLGWGTPFFVVGIAGGVSLIFKGDSPSCWMAIKGGPIWGYGAPAYFIIFFILCLYYNGLAKTVSRKNIYNYQKLMRRTLRDVIQLALFLVTWGTGILSFHQEHLFLYQYLFCVSLCFTVVMLCLFARQTRKGFERIYDDEDVEVKFECDDLDAITKEKKAQLYRKYLARKYFDKWREEKKAESLTLGLKIPRLENAVIIFRTDECVIKIPSRRSTINPLHFEFGFKDYNSDLDEDSDDENDLKHLKEYDENFQISEEEDEMEDEEIELTSDEDGSIRSIKYNGSVISLKSIDNISAGDLVDQDKDETSDEDDSDSDSDSENEKSRKKSVGDKVIDPVVSASKEFTSVHTLHMEQDSELSLRASSNSIGDSKTEVFTSVHTLNLQQDGPTPIPEESKETPVVEEEPNSDKDETKNEDNNEENEENNDTNENQNGEHSNESNESNTGDPTKEEPSTVIPNNDSEDPDEDKTSPDKYDDGTDSDLVLGNESGGTDQSTESDKNDGDENPENDNAENNSDDPPSNSNESEA